MAGIRPVMITGDHKDTAVAIAKDLGILTEGTEAIEGAALEDLTDERDNIRVLIDPFETDDALIDF